MTIFVFLAHSYRRTSATLAANVGITNMELMNLGGWNTLSSATKYIEQGDANKLNLNSLIKNGILV
jgi:hypothetical protein